MFALFGVLFFAIAFILHVFVRSAERIVADVEILGFLCIAAELAWGWGGPLLRGRRTRV
jgi:hypothetical protein